MRIWSNDEELVLVDYYFSCPENMHTDSHQNCREFARQLGRSASAVDMRLRNLRSLLEDRGLPHAPGSLSELLQRFKKDRARIRIAADQVRRRRGWRRIC
jgi:hypothetical protein